MHQNVADSPERFGVTQIDGDMVVYDKEKSRSYIKSDTTVEIKQ